MKIIKCFNYVEILCVLFFLRYHLLAIEKRVKLSLLTLYRIRQGGIVLVRCFHGAS